MDRVEVEKVKGSIDIVSVVSGYVALKKRGRTYVGLCPFHAEKTPSFHVNPARQTYKCFGCGKGGDVFNFLMEIKGLSFAESLKELADQAGIRLEDRRDPRKSEKKRIYDINRMALEFFRRMLRSPAGEGAMAYLRKRGLSEETIDAFELGFAPEGWDSLLKELRSRGVGAEAAARCGLLAERSSGGHYDRFRGRVIFPIRDISSEVIAFGGRILGEGEPKYLNSPESAVFTKRKVLYNLHRVRGSIRSSGVAVVEGYMDVVSLSNAGFPAAVATLGTALTEDHVQLLGRFTDRVSLVFDGDAAGRNATFRAVEPFLGSELIPKVVLLPQGKDPDDVVRSDCELWGRLLEEAPSLWDFIFDESFSTHDTSKLQDKRSLVRELASIISRVRDPLFRELLVQRLSLRIDMPQETIAREMKRDEKKSPAPSRDVTGGHAPLEEIVTRLMLSDERAIRMVKHFGFAGEFRDSDLSALARFLVAHGTEGLDAPGCPDSIRLQASRIAAEGEFPGDTEKALFDMACRFQSMAIEADIRRIQRELLDAEEKGDRIRRNSLLAERQNKINERKHMRERVMEVLQRI
jgi:DNA primase